jgi:alpha-D-ribose 1-methylphosphonate 5-triphosphate synthase subunit PhnH
MSPAVGLADPVHGSQAVFRRVLDAMSRPGRVQELPADLFALPSRPALPLGSAAAAVLLTLCDGETALWWSPGPRLLQLQDWARFHAGVRWVEAVEDADVVGLRASALTPELWSRLRPGSDVAPHTAATLIVEVDVLDALPEVPAAPADAAPAHLTGEAVLTLQGPGIEHTARLRVGGIAPEVWQARRDQSAIYPCGVDLLLCCGHRVAGLPRSTRLIGLDT